MNTNFETLLFQKENGVATIALNRPKRLNAFNTQMRDDFWQILNAIKDDDEIMVILLKGEGSRAFCAGADLTEFGSAPSPNLARQIRFERGIWELWVSIHKPFIVSLHGFVIGSGLEMALLCDIRISSKSALFSLPETSLGLLPAAGGSQTIRTNAGLSEGLRMLLTSTQIDASEAKRLGIVHHVVEENRLGIESKILAQNLLCKDQKLLQLTKLAVNRGSDLPLQQGLELEARLASQMLASISS